MKYLYCVAVKSNSVSQHTLLFFFTIFFFFCERQDFTRACYLHDSYSRYLRDPQKKSYRLEAALRAPSEWMAPRIIAIFLSPTEFIDAHSECKYWNVFALLPNPNSVTADELRLGSLCIASQGRISELSTFHSFFFLRFFCVQLLYNHVVGTSWFLATQSLLHTYATLLLNSLFYTWLP